MDDHGFKVYMHHLTFLKDFPELAHWLDCHCFTVYHSHEDLRSQIVYTFWGDHTAEAEKKGVNDAENNLVIEYCRECKTVGVYQRKMITKTADEKGYCAQLDLLTGNSLEQRDKSLRGENSMVREFP